MNSVSSFLENIIAVEDNVEPHQSRPVSFSDRSRRSTQGSEDLPGLEKTDSTKTDPLSRELADAGPADVVRPPCQGRVSDYWYLEDDQKKVSNQLTDRIMEKVLSVMLSTELKPASDRDPRSVIHKTRPALSMHLMSINTTQMAQKTSPVFEFLDACAYAAGWHNPWHTVGVFMLATLVVLRPYLATALPPSVLLKNFLVPSYLRLYAPDPSVVDHVHIHRNPCLHAGAPVAKYEPPKQISQFSREFVMNFTDLQNHMIEYIRLYDAAVAWGQHYFLFEDTRLSTVVFLALLGTIVFNIVALPRLVPLFIKVVPVKLSMLVFVWSSAALSHPYVREKVLETFDTEEARESRRDLTDRVENALIRAIADDDESEDSVVKEVEVYELHSLSAGKIWEPIGFTCDFFALNHPRRHSNELRASLDSPELQPVSSPSSTESGDRTTASCIEEESINIFRKATLGEIKPPKHWKYAEKEWQIDLDPVTWVKSNYIMDLVNVDDEEKWVYDYVGADESCDGQIFRRRRWVRQCIREFESARETREVLGATSSERLSKTFTTLLS